MSGRTANAAVEGFIGGIREVLNCVIDQIHLVSSPPPYPSDNEYALTLNNGTPARLSASAPLYFGYIHWYRIVEGGERGANWRVETTGYFYKLEARIATDEFREILAFQWDQREGQAVTHPHLHIRSFAGHLQYGLNSAHFPTGDITLASVIRFLIDDTGARPRRSDWDSVLQQMEL